MVCGVWFLVNGMWLVVCGSWSVVGGPWCVDCGLWLMVRGCWFVVRGLCSVVGCTKVFWLLLRRSDNFFRRFGNILALFLCSRLKCVSEQLIRTRLKQVLGEHAKQLFSP